MVSESSSVDTAAFTGARAFALFMAAALACALAASTHAGVADFSAGLLRYVGERWGKDAPYRLLNWQQLLRASHFQTSDYRVPDGQAQAGAAPPRGGNATPAIERRLLESTNRFWNRVPYASDEDHWGMQEYWATPVEMQGSNAGDCEDYAFGKYFSLRELGIPAAKLRITYVRASGWDATHMVLAYYPEVDADPLILDNLTDEISPASRRTDLQPIYSFNDDDLWTPDGAGKTRRSSQIRLWRELLEKMAKEREM
jgi:predicted transglutaminase-like cysteine proteinase